MEGKRWTVRAMTVSHYEAPELSRQGVTQPRFERRATMDIH